jgi:VanZ family protein
MLKFKNIVLKKKNLLIFWTLFVFVLIAWPMADYYGTVVTYYDKIIHAILFGVFYYLLFILLKEKTSFSFLKIYLISFLSAVFYSALGEFIQTYVPGRTVSEYDFFAGVFGIFLFSILTYVRYKK